MFIESYDNGISGNHLILESEELTNVGYKTRMLTENDIPDFLRCCIIREDGKDRYIYDITSYISLYDMFEDEEMDHKFLCCLINGMAAGLESISEYLLAPCHLIFDPRHIYVDRDRNRILWCYYPGSYTTLCEGMNELSEYILKKADHKDDAALALAYGLYKQVVNEDYSLRRLVSGSDPVTCPIASKEAEDDIYEVTDDKEFTRIREYDAPYIPVFGKVIIGICIVCLIFVSVFTFTASLYGSDSLKIFMELTEMRLFIAAFGAMSVMLPLLIILNWFNRYGKFKKTLRDDQGMQDDVYMHLSGKDNDVQFGWEL